MGLISFSNIADGTTIDGADVNIPMNTIYDEFNGKIDSNNLKDGAVTGAKIASTTITPDKVAGPTTVTSSATITPTTATRGVVVTALATNATIAAPTGTPYDTQTLIIRIKDDGTGRTLTWDATYVNCGVTKPTSTTANKTVYVVVAYNSSLTRWDVVSVSREA